MRHVGMILGTATLALVAIAAAGAGVSGQDAPDRPPPNGGSQQDLWRVENRCAANSLYLLLRMNHKEVDYAEVESHVPVTARGANLADMRRGAERYGLAADVVKATPEYLKRCPLPAVAHVEPENGGGTRGHYVVVTAAGSENVELIDGTTAMADVVPWAKFGKQWSGYLLVTRTSARGVSRLAVCAVLLGTVTVGLALVTWYYRPESRSRCAPAEAKS